jgi:hypothetical protein
MKLSKLLLFVVATPLLGACHDSDGSGATGFDPFVTNLIQGQTTETGAPVPVEGQTFVFPTDANAFADLLPPDTGPVVE